VHHRIAHAVTPCNRLHRRAHILIGPNPCDDRLPLVAAVDPFRTKEREIRFGVKCGAIADIDKRPSSNGGRRDNDALVQQDMPAAATGLALLPCRMAMQQRPAVGITKRNVGDLNAYRPSWRLHRTEVRDMSRPVGRPGHHIAERFQFCSGEPQRGRPHTGLDQWPADGVRQ